MSTNTELRKTWGPATDSYRVTDRITIQVREKEEDDQIQVAYIPLIKPEGELDARMLSHVFHDLQEAIIFAFAYQNLVMDDPGNQIKSVGPAAYATEFINKILVRRQDV